VKVKYNHGGRFYAQLRLRVDSHFEQIGISRRDNPQMYFKTAVMLLWFAASYVLLLLTTETWWQGIALAVSLSLSIGGIGFNVQHDGGHRGYSDRALINRLMATSLDLLGCSSYVWRWKHNILHHTYTNVAGMDDDIEIGPVGRFSPRQPLYRVHRFQHLYLWPFYGLLLLKWQILDDFTDLWSGKISGYPFPRPRGSDLIVLLGGKALFVAWAFIIPTFFHPTWIVALFYIITVFPVGIISAVVFQVAHCVEEAVSPTSLEGSVFEKEWAIHQVESTIDFARGNRVLKWYLGGLNFQIEHHLFPRICHIHYATVARIVEETCAAFGVRYTAYDTLLSAVASHGRWLRRMGQS
jgi:linoleoyl-CoA desaturase